jgi:hypothetical protein
VNKILFIIVLVSMTFGSRCLAEDACPHTIATTDSPRQGDSHWYGSDSFAVQLPAAGTWPTTAPGALIAVKVFWRSAGFRPGMESSLDVKVKPLNGARASAVVAGNTNAYVESLGGWTMLTGIDFPMAGCWEITGTYLGQGLRFVVETFKARRVSA